MTKIKQAMVKDVSDKFGPDAVKVIEYLYDTGLLDDARARKHIATVRVFEMMQRTKMSVLCIHEVVGEDLGISRRTLRGLA
jgi:hypothetical protein